MIASWKEERVLLALGLSMVLCCVSTGCYAQIALFFRIPWTLVEAFRCDVVVRLLNTHVLGDSNPTCAFLEQQLRS
jgi:hypothetical protein